MQRLRSVRSFQVQRKEAWLSAHQLSRPRITRTVVPRLLIIQIRDQKTTQIRYGDSFPPVPIWGTKSSFTDLHVRRPRLFNLEAANTRIAKRVCTCEMRRFPERTEHLSLTVLNRFYATYVRESTYINRVIRLFEASTSHERFHRREQVARYRPFLFDGLK